MERYLVFDGSFVREYIGYVDCDDESEVREIVRKLVKKCCRSVVEGEVSVEEYMKFIMVERLDGGLELSEEEMMRKFGDINWMGDLKRVLEEVEREKK